MDKEYILCAAIHIDDGMFYEHQPKNIISGIVVCGRRHHNCVYNIYLMKMTEVMKKNHLQGFITNKDRFVNREEAFHIAYAAKQLNNPESYSADEVACLISEDLY